MHQSSSYWMIVFFFFKFFWLFYIHLLKVDFSRCQKEKRYSLFNSKSNCPCICRGVKKDVWLARDLWRECHFCRLQGKRTYLRLLQDNRNTEARFLRASHVASENISPKNRVCDTYDSYLKCPFVFNCICHHLHTIIYATIGHWSND